MSYQKWRALRRGVQALSFLAFLALVVWTLRDVRPPLPPDLLLRLDPLAGLAAMIGSRAWLVRFLPGAAVLVGTLALGRAWCGWLCPLGTLIEWTSPAASAASSAPRSGWRRLKYLLLLLVLFSALWGGLTLLVLDPLTIFVRSVGTAVLPALTALVTAAETALYRFPALREGLGAIDAAVRGTLLSYEPTHTAGALLVAGFVGGILALNIAAPRGWCRYVCPLGGLLGLVSKGSWLKRRVLDACVACKACEKACPMGTVDGQAGYASDSGECTLCLDCAPVCPKGAISFAGGWGLERSWGYEPSRRQALGALGLSVVALGLAKVDPLAEHPHARRLRPPGVGDDDAFLAACIRCGQCLRVCPTHGLQPALAEAGWVGFWTPVLVPRLGQCEYSCTACGEHCPTGAIPRLAAEDKQSWAIGKAYVDPAICIPWSGRGDCIVCEEMCPVPEKAIRLVERPVEEPGGSRVLLAPEVHHERCIGCGLCERKCPVNGEAAIRVRVDPFG